MESGPFIIEQLSEGFFEFVADGSIAKMHPKQLHKPEKEMALNRHSSVLGIDPLLIQTPHSNLVIDPGLGWGLDKNSPHKHTSNVVTNLDVELPRYSGHAYT